MSLIPWRNKRNELAAREPADAYPLGRLRSEIDRLFDRFFTDPFGSMDAFFTPLGEWAPSIDVAESEQEITVRAEIPGVDPKDLDIQLTENVLTLRGEKKEMTERKGDNYYHGERRFGTFQRVICLPVDVDPEKVSAEHANGVVTIRLAKVPGAAPKRIPVKVASR